MTPFLTILDQKMMISDLRPASSYALVKFKKILKFSGKEFLRWLKTQILELEREFSILFVTVAQNTFKRKFMRLYLSSTTIKNQTSEEQLIR